MKSYDEQIIQEAFEDACADFEQQLDIVKDLIADMDHALYGELNGPAKEIKLVTVKKLNRIVREYNRALGEVKRLK